MHWFYTKFCSKFILLLHWFYTNFCSNFKLLSYWFYIKFCSIYILLSHWFYTKCWVILYYFCFGSTKNFALYVAMDQEAILVLLQQTVKLSIEAMSDFLPVLRRNLFSIVVHAGQAAIQSLTLTAVVSLISIAKFSNDIDILTYLNTFWCAAIKNQWDKSTWAVTLRGLLTGKAAEATLMLPLNQTSGYDEVKREVFRIFGVTSVAYQCRFCSEQKEADQSFIDCGRRLERLSIKCWVSGLQNRNRSWDPETENRWYPTIDERRSA